MAALYGTTILVTHYVSGCVGGAIATKLLFAEIVGVEFSNS
ncbi:MAG: hypothetical protein AB4040_01420 [Synechococcus sp.]